jgi:hypothetical protein
MADEQARASSEFKPEDEIDELFARANANPARTGCPPRDVLLALARKQRPIGDAAYEHLAKCSPCYLEMRQTQQRDRDRRRTRAIWIGAAAAAILFVAVGIAWLRLGGSGAQRPEIQAALDLRPYATTRGVGQPSDLPPLSLPRRRTTLTLLLPTGSESGPYEVQILDSNLTSRATAVGSATLENHVTTLRVSIDAASLAGRYQLAVRHTGDQWQMFPLTVK